MDTYKKRILTAKVALALRDEYNRQPSRGEVERYALAARVLYKAVLGLHFERKQQKQSGQLAIF